MHSENFESENRIFILGNSGSGKTWLAGVLANYLDLKMISLDEVCWEPGGYYKRRAEEDINQSLREKSQGRDWVIEGVYGDLAELLLSRITHLYWLDLDPAFCAESVSLRGFENIPWMDSESKIQGYLTHIRSYRKNAGPMSREFHANLFRSFTGTKAAFKSRDSVNEFVETLK